MTGRSGLSPYDRPMRARGALLPLIALMASSCAFGAGVEPAPSTTTTTTAPAHHHDHHRRGPQRGGPGGGGRRPPPTTWGPGRPSTGTWRPSSCSGRPPASPRRTRPGWTAWGRPSVDFSVGDVGPADEGAGALVAVHRRGRGGRRRHLGVRRAASRWCGPAPAGWWTGRARVLHPSLEEDDTLRVARTWSTARRLARRGRAAHRLRAGGEGDRGGAGRGGGPRRPGAHPPGTGRHRPGRRPGGDRAARGAARLVRPRGHRPGRRLRRRWPDDLEALPGVMVRDATERGGARLPLRRPRGGHHRPHHRRNPRRPRRAVHRHRRRGPLRPGARPGDPPGGHPRTRRCSGSTSTAGWWRC